MGCFAIYGTVLTMASSEVNPVAKVFWFPAKALAIVLNAWWQLPGTIRLLIILALLVAFFVSTLTEAGPFKVATIARRFSWIGIPIATVFIWWSWIAILFWNDPTLRTDAAMWSSVLLIVLIYWSFFTYYVLLRGHMHRGIFKSAFRRMRFRLRWESIARACGMAHERDVRPNEWWKGGTNIVRQRALIVQWVPTLWHGRRGSSPGITHYLIRPARGISDKQWSDPKSGEDKHQLEKAIAISAMAKTCILTKGDKSSRNHNWWTLTLFWNDIEDYREEIL